MVPYGHGSQPYDGVVATEPDDEELDSEELDSKDEGAELLDSNDEEAELLDSKECPSDGPPGMDSPISNEKVVKN